MDGSYHIGRENSRDSGLWKMPEDAALAEREGRGGWVADGDYAALVPCATGEGWIGGERFNSSLGVVGFHCWFSFLLVV